MQFLYRQSAAGYKLFYCDYCQFARIPHKLSRQAIQNRYGPAYLDYLKSGQGSITGIRFRPSAEGTVSTKKRLLSLIRPENLFLNPQNNLVFEIGFGAGEFLEIFYDLGFSVAGCDLSQECVDHARIKLPGQFERGFFEELDLPKNQYAVVVMSSVLEHFQNPKTALQKAYDILHFGGSLIIIGIDFNSWRRKYDPNWNATPRQLYFFSPKSIKLLLTELGFDEIKFYHPHNWIKRGFSFIKNILMVKKYQKFYLLAKKPKTGFCRR
ncbi:MAG: class I SAM-dependent methyltransferase [Parcubacteria group bacterium]|nr:class I SAM-dependent methyltransferase [Parcubacteria group bacterium]